MEFSSAIRNKFAWKFGLSLLVKNPILTFKYGLSYLRRKQNIALLTGSSLNEVESCYRDVLSNTVLRSHLELQLGHETYYGQNLFKAPELYVICRLLRPRLVVETGVAAGYSSTFVLQALHDEGSGHLHSIDIGQKGFDNVKLPINREVGWLVPPWLRSRWSLHLGSSSDLLEPLLKRLREVDLFYHDSDHSYKNMTFEFETAWKYLNSSGIILSDDVGWNNSFLDFCREKGLKSNLISLSLGGARKNQPSLPSDLPIAETSPGFRVQSAFRYLRNLT